MQLAHLLERVEPIDSHVGRLMRIIGNPYRQEGNAYWDCITHFKAKGYAWAIGEKFVQAFRYAACIRAKESLDSPLYPVRSRGGNVRYIGDIPDFALDNIEAAIKNGLQAITIHSNEPLPTEVFKMVDPVAVGWAETPNIYLDYHQGDYRGGKPYKHCLNHAQGKPLSHPGFVLAIWDENGNPTELS